MCHIEPMPLNKLLLFSVLYVLYFVTDYTLLLPALFQIIRTATSGGMA